MADFVEFDVPVRSVTGHDHFLMGLIENNIWK